MFEDNTECAVLNVEIGLRIFFTLMATNSSAERSFSQLKHIKYPNRATMRQEKLDSAVDRGRFFYAKITLMT